MNGTIELIDAIKQLKYRCTVKGVADLLHRNDEAEQVRQELSELLCDAGGRFEINLSREIVYIFPSRGLRQRILAKRKLLKLYVFFWEKLIPFCIDGLKLFFGVFIVFSVVLGLLVVFVASGSRRAHGSFHNRPFFWFFVCRHNPFFDLLRINRRFAEQELPTNTSNRSSGHTFIEEVFSFLFGTGTHPGPSERERWGLQADVIRGFGGVVPVKVLKPMQKFRYSREDWIIGVLAKLGGSPVASDDGKLVYSFETLKNQAYGRTLEVKAFVEKKWIFSDKPIGLPLALGIANMFFLVLANVKMSKLRLVAGRKTSLSGFSLLLFSWMEFPLRIYAIMYLLVPLLRYIVLVNVANCWIERRNTERQKIASTIVKEAKDNTSELYSELQFTQELAKARP